MTNRVAQARSAMRHAFEVRRDLGIEQHHPVCPIDAADRRGVEVWFSGADSMEGLYVRDVPARILIPSERPFGRQVFACAHELGHHELGHGTKLHEYMPESAADTAIPAEEFAAHVFAGALLMPRAAVEHAFRVRGWSVQNSAAEQIYVVACALGVSFEGLLIHLWRGLSVLSADRARELARVPLPKLRKSFLGVNCPSRLVVVDRRWEGIAVDLAVGESALLPNHASADGPCVRHARSLESGEWFEAVRPGVGKVALSNGWSAFVRVRRQNFVGLGSIRHQDDPDVE